MFIIYFAAPGGVSVRAPSLNNKNCHYFFIISIPYMKCWVLELFTDVIIVELVHQEFGELQYSEIHIEYKCQVLFASDYSPYSAQHM